MNLSSASTTYLTGKNHDVLGSQSEKYLSPSKRSLSPSGSPYGKRLDTLKHTLNSDSIGDIYSYEKIVNSITEASEKNRKQIEERIHTCSDQCANAEKKIQKDTEVLQKLDERRMAELLSVENALIDQFNNESAKIRDNRNAALKNMEERAIVLKAEVVKTKNATEEAYKSTVKRFDDKLNHIQENFAEMSRIRKEANDKIVQNIGGRLKKIEETLKSEKAICARIDETFMRAAEELNKRMSIQVETEKHRREKAEEQMLNL